MNIVGYIEKALRYCYHKAHCCGAVMARNLGTH